MHRLQRSFTPFSHLPKRPLPLFARSIGFLLGFALLWLTPSPGFAAENGINAQRLKLRWGRNDLFGVSTSPIDDGLRYAGGLRLNYGHRPLVLVNQEGDIQRIVVGGQLMGDFGASLCWNRWVETGLTVPVALYQFGEGMAATGTPDAVAFGDLRLDTKVNLWGKNGGLLGVALAPTVTVPSGSDGFLGDRSVTVTPRLVVDARLGKFTAVLNLDYTWREPASLTSTTLDQELGVGLGGSFSVREHVLLLIAELYTSTNITAPFADGGESAAELLVGARARPGFFSPVRSIKDDFAIELAAATGLAPGVGTPVFRLLAGLVWSPITIQPEDSDGDGIIDSIDACHTAAEDVDGFRDWDGCPDEDNDDDGIPDRLDACPLEAEDIDSFSDEDGCPDDDNDDDAVLDSIDQCPLQAEDRDGWSDADGCPDKDNDRDGILDSKDECPDEAEDKDGFEDFDGCPDTDNDGDGVPDKEDQCPLVAEDADGWSDDDGCPDEDNDGDDILDALDKCPDQAEDFDRFDDNDGCPEEAAPTKKVRIAGSKIEITDKVYFQSGSDRILLSKSRSALDAVIRSLKENPWIEVMEIQGHTDDRGSEELNQRLSQKRAEAVLRYLVEQGIDRARLKAKGYGESMPIRTNKTARGRATNRRVEFQIAEGEPPAVIIEGDSSNQ